MKRVAMSLAIAALVAAPAVALAADERFGAELTPEAEVPPATGTDATGTARVTIKDDGSIEYEVSYQDLTGDAIGAHIHYGAADVAGPVMYPFAHGPSPFSGTLTEADFVPIDGGPQTHEEGLQAIRDGLTYVNVHTEANQPGEIRGQLEALPPTSTATGEAGSMAVTWIALVALGAAAFLVGVLRMRSARA